jgi:S1-C subfamily serine protease
LKNDSPDWVYIEDLITNGGLSTTELAGGDGGSAFQDLSDGAGILVGFDLVFNHFKGHRSLRGIRPLFQSPKGLIEGSFHGAKNRSDTKRVLAKNGYAVGGISCAVDNVANRRIKVTFMKISSHGLNVNDAYQTEWFGNFGSTKTMDLKSSGGFVIGIEGSSGEGLDSIGLMEGSPRKMLNTRPDSTITLQSDFTTNINCTVIDTSHGILLVANKNEGGQTIETIKSFRSPLSIKARVKPVGNNVRLHYAGGMIIFNWEMQPHELRLHLPPTAKPYYNGIKNKGIGVKGKGHLSRGAWHDIEWRIENDRMTVWADGELRSESARSFPELNSPLAIGSANDGSFLLEGLQISELINPVSTTTLVLPNKDSSVAAQKRGVLSESAYPDKEQPAKVAILPRRREDSSKTEKKPEFGFDEIKDFLVIVNCGDTVGSGFIADINGVRYIVTNQHVINGHETVTFTTAAGKVLRPKKVELSRNRDIARLQVSEPSGLKIASNIKMNDSVIVMGNSQGAGVITELKGVINGIGSDRIEVTAEFVQGNSGSPILNQDMEVCGIATYVQFYKETKVDKGTRWEGMARRFAFRVENVSWAPVSWKTYNQTYGKNLLESDNFRYSLYEFINDWMENPDNKIIISDSSIELQRWAKQHNIMTSRISRQRSKGSATAHELKNANQTISKDLLDSTNALMTICEDKARYLRFMAEQSKTTKYLKTEFETRAEELELVSGYIRRYGSAISSRNWFRF